MGHKLGLAVVVVARLVPLLVVVVEGLIVAPGSLNGGGTMIVVDRSTVEP